MGAKPAYDRMSARVLVVDDHGATRELMTVMLSHLGFEVEAVSTGAAAFASVAASPPDVILLDVMMPDMDGFTVLTRLKDDPRTAGIPVIVLTAKVQEQVRSDARALGAAHYIGKPVTRDELVNGIRSVLGRSG